MLDVMECLRIIDSNDDDVFAAIAATPSTNGRFKSMMPTTADLYRQLGMNGTCTRRYVVYFPSAA